MATIPKLEAGVAAAFKNVPPAVRRKLLGLRRLIFETAATTEGVGPLTETLKWGEPAYLTEASGSGTTIRIAWKAATPSQYALYVHCQTRLIDRFLHRVSGRARVRRQSGHRLRGFRPDAKEPLSHCIAMALTYHRDKRSVRKR